MSAPAPSAVVAVPPSGTALALPASKIPGKYEMVSSENFDDYLKACQVNVAKRAAAAAAKATIEITEADGVYTVKTSSVFKNTNISFKPNQEFEEETADGRKCKTIVDVANNKWTQTQKIDTLVSILVREFTDTEMKASFTCNGVTGRRVYKRIA